MLGRRLPFSPWILAMTNFSIATVRGIFVKKA